MYPGAELDMKEFRERIDRDFAIFDPASFLRRIDNDRELYSDLIRLVHRNLPEQFGFAKAAHAKNDMAELRLISHRIKGSADNVSALRVREAALGIEKEATAGRRNDLKSLLSILSEKIQEFRANVSEIPPSA